MKQARMLLQDLKQADLDAYRPIPFWSWNDKLQPQELRRQIRCMKQKHMGGFFMHARGGLETEYLSGEWFDAVKTSLEEAKAQNMGAWCYDENGWPSGFAGGELLKEEKNYAHYLRFAKKPEFEAEALAVYILQENKLRRVTCACPQAREYLCVYDCRNPSNVDILNPEITRAFLQLTHEKYYEHFKGEFGKTLKGFFTDEPQYFRYETAYTPVMLTAYHAAYGRDLLEMLGALFVDCEGARAFRFRYWRMMNALYCENFIGIIYQWCNQHNCMLTGHTIEESQMADQMWCCAGVMPFYEYEHIPGIDWLGREIGTELAPRQVSSVAQQLGKPQVLTETFACVGWDVTPKELKRIAEWQYVNGVNLMCQHLYPYSIRGQRKRDYPAFYSEHNPWTEELATFNDYFTKLGYLLSQSQEAADVLILHPIHSAYLTYNRQTDYESIRALSDNFNALIGFQVMLWVVPYVVTEGIVFRNAWENALLRKKTHGEPYYKKWWNGLSCVWDFTKEPAVQRFKGMLDKLIQKYQVDGFKFDGCDPLDRCNQDLIRYCKLGLEYPVCEIREGYLAGGMALVSRQQDKRHCWESNGLASLIPNGMMQSLMGYWYHCPDMVGGGDLASINEESLIDPELFVRYMQCVALFPVVQFSRLPRECLDEAHMQQVLRALEKRQTFLPCIKQRARLAAATGEPIIAPLAYYYPEENLELIRNEFCLGKEWIVSPVLKQGETQHSFTLPAGEWQDSHGTVYKGGRHRIKVGLSDLPVFRRRLG